MDEGRRKLRRFRLVCSLPVIDRDSGEQIGMLEDITVEGLRLKGPNLLQTGRTFHVTLQLPVEIERRTGIELNAHCVWSSESGTPGLYEAGFSFVNPSWEATEIIDKLIVSFKR